MYNLKVNDPHFLPHCGCDIELTIKSGECAVIVGENGVGKTTLIRHFYEQQNKHAVLIEQKPLDIFYDRRLGKLKEIFLTTGHDFLDRDFFDRCWTSLGLNLKHDRFLATLSGGEGQALKICLGLAQKVPILFFDEPSQFLDSHSKLVLNELLQKLLEEKKSVFIVEHDVAWLTIPITFYKLGITERQLKVDRTWSI